ncbi:unnamed protein product [Boreogadus saida]
MTQRRAGSYLEVVPRPRPVRQAAHCPLLGLFLSHHALPPIKSYYYVDQKLNWTDAQQHCREQNGDLATVDNVADLQHLQESRTGFNYDDDFMWIGLYDDRTRWKWSLGDQDYKIGQNYGTWYGPDPDFWNNKENCTGTTPSGSWFDTSCYSLKGAVCFDDEESNYILVQNTMTWYEALQYCRSHYTDLASVRNAAENGKVLALNPQSSWIGLHRHPWSDWSDGRSFIDQECGYWYNFACQRKPKQRSIFKLKISSEADMTDPVVGQQILELLHAKLAEVGVTGANISWVLKDGQVFHKDQPSET